MSTALLAAHIRSSVDVRLRHWNHILLVLSGLTILLVALDLHLCFDQRTREYELYGECEWDGYLRWMQQPITILSILSLVRMYTIRADHLSRTRRLEYTTPLAAFKHTSLWRQFTAECCMMIVAPIPYLLSPMGFGGLFPFLLLTSRLYLVLRLVRDHSGVYERRAILRDGTPFAESVAFPMNYESVLKITFFLHSAKGIALLWGMVATVLGISIYTVERQFWVDSSSDGSVYGTWKHFHLDRLSDADREAHYEPAYYSTFPRAFFNTAFKAGMIIWISPNPSSTISCALSVVALACGLLISALMIGIITNKLAPDAFQQFAIEWHQTISLDADKRDCAARILQISWRIHRKYRASLARQAKGTLTNAQSGQLDLSHSFQSSPGNGEQDRLLSQTDSLSAPSSSANVTMDIRNNAEFFQLLVANIGIWCRRLRDIRLRQAAVHVTGTSSGNQANANANTTKNGNAEETDLVPEHSTPRLRHKRLHSREPSSNGDLVSTAPSSPEMKQILIMLADMQMQMKQMAKQHQQQHSNHNETSFNRPPFHANGSSRSGSIKSVPSSPVRSLSGHHSPSIIPTSGPVTHFRSRTNSVVDLGGAPPASSTWLLVLLVWMCFWLDFVIYSCPLSFYPLRMSQVGYTKASIGMLMGLKAFVQLCAAPLNAMIGAKVGGARMLLGGCTCLGLSSLMFGVLPISSYGWLLLARGLQGYASSAMFNGGLSLLSAAFETDESRADAIGLALGGAAIGVLSGSFLGGCIYSLSGEDIAMPFYCCSGVCVILILVQLSGIEFNANSVPSSAASSSVNGESTVSFSPSAVLAVVVDPRVLRTLVALMFCNVPIVLSEIFVPLFVDERYRVSDLTRALLLLPLTLVYFTTTLFMGRILTLSGLSAYHLMTASFAGFATLWLLLGTVMDLQLWLVFGVLAVIGIPFAITEANVFVVLARVMQVFHSRTTPMVAFAAGDISMNLGALLGAYGGGFLLHITSLEHVFIFLSAVMGLMVVSFVLVGDPMKEVPEIDQTTQEEEEGPTVRREHDM